MTRKQRDRLVIEHLGLVRDIAKNLKRRLPACFDLDDLISAGTIGLINAAPLFDPKAHPGVPFGAFVRKRIKGEILEAVGAHKAESTRTTRRRRWEEATRPPIKRTDCHPDPRQRPEDLVEAAERAAVVSEAISTLPDRERVVIELHYRAELQLGEIGERPELEVGASRVSQIHTGAIRRLRSYFALRGLKEAA